MLEINIPSIPVQEIFDNSLAEKSVQLFIKREDLNHPYISGNKLRKLKYNLIEAKAQGKKKLLTFGGAFSNHIFSVAAAGKEFGFETIGIIRGEETLPLNPTLFFAQEQGMNLEYIDRESYRQKEKAGFIETLKSKWGDFYLIPEGGSNELAVKGASEILEDCKETYDFYCCPAGTGGTSAGLIYSLPKDSKALIFSVLKDDFIKDEILGLIKAFSGQVYSKNNFEVLSDYHFGGYAKFKPELIGFINRFKQHHQIQLDPVYTGKMIFGIFNLIESGFLPPESRILAIHTGGLQGISGFNTRFGNLLI